MKTIYNLFHTIILETGNLEINDKLSLEYKDVINEIIIMIKNVLEYLLLSGIDIIMYILRPLYILLIILGIVKYSVSGLSPRSRNILSGGILLAVFTEFILPMLLDFLIK